MAYSFVAMEELFTEEFTDNQLRKEAFTIYRLAANLYQAKSELKTIVLWKVKDAWEGATTIAGSDIVDLIGRAIDNFLKEKKIQNKG